MRTIRWRRWITFAVLASLAGCAADQQWMKVGEPYTTAEFRREYDLCPKNLSLDEECLHAKRWVDCMTVEGSDAPQFSEETPFIVATSRPH